MIEFLLGIAVAVMLIVVGTRHSDDDRAKLEAENAQLRAGLRYIRDTIPGSQFARAYINRLLGDEAGS